MDYNVDLFSSLAADDSDRRVAHRKSLAVANKRVSDRYGAFLAAAKNREDYSARLDLIRADVREAVASVCNEHGGDPDRIERSIYSHLADRTADFGDSYGGLDEGSYEDARREQGNFGKGNLTCKNCGEHLFGDEEVCPNCDWNLYGDADYPVDQPSPGWELGGEAGPYLASTKEARRPKMCPYHREVTDISLASQDPTAGFNAMSQHAWGEQHCQGGFEGKCNFKPAMVTQSYWDEKAEQAQERRERREQERAQQQEIFEPEAQDIVPDSPEGIEDTPAPEEGSLDSELAEAPSAVGEGYDAEPASDMGSLEPMAAATKEGEALKTVEVDQGSAEDGSPKIDKGKWDPMNRGQSGKPIDTEDSGSPHPTETIDPVEPIKADRADDFLDQTDAVTESQDVEKTAPVQTDKANSGSWSGNNGASPVTSSVEKRHAASDQAVLGSAGDYPVLHNDPHSILTQLSGIHPEGPPVLNGRPFDQVQVYDPEFGGSEGGNVPITIEHPDPRMVAATKHVLENTHAPNRETIGQIIGQPDPRQVQASVEPRSNPIIDMLQSGFVPQAQVDKAIDEWKNR